jgi:hypothetical protein
MWQDNITILKEFRSTYPEFWKYLVKIATGLDNYRNETGSPLVIDDHGSNLTRAVKMIGLSYYRDQDGQLSQDQISGYDWHPPAWCFYYHPDVTCLCKNSLHIDKSGRAHIITAATGINVSGKDFKQLNKGHQLSMEYMSGKTEFTFVLPIGDFISTVLDVN